MSSFVLPKPEQLVDLVGQIGAIKLTMDGAFDQRIADLKAAAAALDEMTNKVNTLSQAQKIKDDAQALSEATQTACSQAVAKANDTLGAALAREAQVTARETAVTAREGAATTRSQFLDDREKSIIFAQDSRDRDLDDREDALAKQEAQSKAKLNKLNADIDAFNKRLDALKA